MDNNLLKTATRIFKELNLSEICIKENGSEIMMKRTDGEVKTQSAHAPIIREEKEKEVVANEDKAYINCKEIKAPLVGVFYAASSPDSAPYVKLGDKVKQGQTMCIIEAMKMMNEIKADCDGVVLDICAENGNVVEYGQTLFKLN